MTRRAKYTKRLEQEHVVKSADEQISRKGDSERPIGLRRQPARQNQVDTKTSGSGEPLIEDRQNRLHSPAAQSICGELQIRSLVRLGGARFRFAFQHWW